MGPFTGDGLEDCEGGVLAEGRGDQAGVGAAGVGVGGCGAAAGEAGGFVCDGDRGAAVEVGE